MATIQTRLELHDGVSAPLQKMAENADRATAAINKTKEIINSTSGAKVSSGDNILAASARLAKLQANAGRRTDISNAQANLPAGVVATQRAVTSLARRISTLHRQLTKLPKLTTLEIKDKGSDAVQKIINKVVVLISALRHIPKNIVVKVKLEGDTAFYRLSKLIKSIPRTMLVHTRVTGIPAVMSLSRALKSLPRRVTVPAVQSASVPRTSTPSGGGGSGGNGPRSSLFETFTAANLASRAAENLLDKVLELPGAIIKAADAWTGIQSRLKLVTNDESKVAALNDEIYYAALRSYGSYSDMADAVSKISLVAPKAFPDPAAAVAFAEGIQKLFTMGGTSKLHQKIAMLQTRQSLGAGTLQGDEFRSIAEAAPMIEQMVAKEMGVEPGALKKLASEGQITAQVLRDAILNHLDEINEAFNKMPVTWTMRMQNFGTVAFKSFQGFLDMVTKLASTPLVNDFFVVATVAVQGLASVLESVMNNLLWIANNQAIRDGFMTIAVVIGGALYGLWTLGDNLIQLFGGVLTYLSSWLSALPVILSGLGLYVMYMGLAWVYTNRAMIAAKFKAAADLAMATASKIAAKATSLLSFSVAGLHRRLLFMTGVILAIPAIVLAAMVMFNAWRKAGSNLAETLGAAFDFICGVIEDAVNIALVAVNALIDGLNGMASGLNTIFHTNIDKIPNVEYLQSGAVKHFFSDLGNAVTEATDKIANANIPNQNEAEWQKFARDYEAANGDPAAQTAKNTGETAKNTADFKNELREWAEYADQKLLAKFTTTEVTVDMGGITNTINSPADIDGMAVRVADAFREAVSTAAERAYSTL